MYSVCIAIVHMHNVCDSFQSSAYSVAHV